MNKIINIGIFAHVDAGKTTLTEQLLYKSGAIRTLGRVDTGNTHTDTMDLERERGISIVSQPIAFTYKDLKVNLIDTPGHVDFVAEVERSLLPLDAAILVISAKESVQSHTRTLFHALETQKTPILIAVNKVDRLGVDIDQVLGDIQDLMKKSVPLQVVESYGTKDTQISALPETLDRRFLESLAEVSDASLDAYCQGLEDPVAIEDHFIRGIGNQDFYPLVFMSAMHGIGIEACLEAIFRWLPKPTWPADAPIGGMVFKVLCNHIKTKTHYIKLTSGHIGIRELIGDDKISRIMALQNGQLESVERLYAGDIGLVTGLHHLKVGDTFGTYTKALTNTLAQPSLSVKIGPERPSQRPGLLDALENMAAVDPYLSYQISEVDDHIYLNLFGYVQMEVVKEQLWRQYHIPVNFDDPTAIYKETPLAASEYIAGWGHEGMPYPVGVGLRVEPLPLGSGFQYTSEITTGFLKQTYQNGIEDGVSAYLDQGLKGWGLTDMKVTLIAYEYDSVSSTVSHYRDLTPIVLFEALKKVGTQLLWPIGDFYLNVPIAYMGRAVGDLTRMGASITKQVPETQSVSLTGTIPLVQALHYAMTVRAYTSGQGSFETRLTGYAPAPKGHEKNRVKFKVDPGERGTYLMYKRRAL